jgi:hypothetical protein
MCFNFIIICFLLTNFTCVIFWRYFRLRHTLTKFNIPINVLKILDDGLLVLEYPTSKIPIYHHAIEIYTSDCVCVGSVANLTNIGSMRSRKNVYFTPMSMDDPAGKPHSLVADFSAIPDEIKRILPK